MLARRFGQAAVRHRGCGECIALGGANERREQLGFWRIGGLGRHTRYPDRVAGECRAGMPGALARGRAVWAVVRGMAVIAAVPAVTGMARVTAMLRSLVLAHRSAGLQGQPEPGDREQGAHRACGGRLCAAEPGQQGI